MSQFKNCPFCACEVKNEQLIHTKECYFSVLMKSIQYDREYPYSSGVKPTKKDLNDAWNVRVNEKELKTKAVWDILNHADEVAESESDWIKIVGRLALELERSE